MRDLRASNVSARTRVSPYASRMARGTQTMASDQIAAVSTILNRGVASKYLRISGTTHGTRPSRCACSIWASRSHSRRKSSTSKRNAAVGAKMAISPVQPSQLVALRAVGRHADEIALVLHTTLS